MTLYFIKNASQSLSGIADSKHLLLVTEEDNLIIPKRFGRDFKLIETPGEPFFGEYTEDESEFKSSVANKVECILVEEVSLAIYKKHNIERG
jgi:hypothetical protein